MLMQMQYPVFVYGIFNIELHRLDIKLSSMPLPSSTVINFIIQDITYRKNNLKCRQLIVNH